MKRIESLDYLRGYAAFTIMIYHYMSWSDYHGFFYFFLGKLGYYGVEVFYILSGYTLTLVYEKRDLFKKAELKKFYLKRAFRIFPLLWLCILLTIILKKEIPDMDKLLVNVTGLFSIYRIDEYIVLGSWSIGNELFFYLCFPILISIQKNWQITSVLAFLLIPFTLFAFGEQISTIDIQYSWKGFINPLNHLLLFYVGILLRKKGLKVSRVWSIVIIIVILSVFIWLPFDERQDSVLGFARFYNSTLMVLVVLAFVSIKPNIEKRISKFSKHLGKVSYSLYLLHPLVWGVMGYTANIFDLNLLPGYVGLRIFLSIIASLMVSTMIYSWVEVRFMQMGKRFIAQNQ